MGRLIDADALIEEIRNGDKVASFNYFLSLVQAQPTAYSVENVVEEIEIDRQVDFNYHIRTDYRFLINDIYDKTVQKVRKGGINE